MCWAEPGPDRYLAPEFGDWPRNPDGLGGRSTEGPIFQQSLTMRLHHGTRAAISSIRHIARLLEVGTNMVKTRKGVGLVGCFSMDSAHVSRLQIFD